MKYWIILLMSIMVFALDITNGTCVQIQETQDYNWYYNGTVIAENANQITLCIDGNGTTGDTLTWIRNGTSYEDTISIVPSNIQMSMQIDLENGKIYVDANWENGDDFNASLFGTIEINGAQDAALLTNEGGGLYSYPLSKKCGSIDVKFTPTSAYFNTQPAEESINADFNYTVEKFETKNRKYYIDFNFYAFTNASVVFEETQNREVIRSWTEQLQKGYNLKRAYVKEGDELNINLAPEFCNYKYSNIVGSITGIGISIGKYKKIVGKFITYRVSASINWDELTSGVARYVKYSSQAFGIPEDWITNKQDYLSGISGNSVYSFDINIPSSAIPTKMGGLIEVCGTKQDLGDVCVGKEFVVDLRLARHSLSIVSESKDQNRYYPGQPGVITIKIRNDGDYDENIVINSNVLDINYEHTIPIGATQTLQVPFVVKELSKGFKNVIININGYDPQVVSEQLWVLDRKDLNTTCDFDYECKSGYCVNNVCVYKECETNEECGARKYCKNNVCVRKKSTGDTCDFNYECESGMCNGTCIDCETNEDCGDYGYCLNNVCTIKKQVGEDCNYDFECLSSACDVQCRAKCSTDADCSSNEYCDTYCKSKKGVGLYCTSDDQCVTGMCVENVCAQCVDDSQCSMLEYCLDKKCYRKKKKGESCIKDFECITGACIEGSCGFFGQTLQISTMPTEPITGENVTVVVTDNKGAPMPNTKVKINGVTYKTNEKGMVVFTPQTNKIEVVAEKKGYRSAQVELKTKSGENSWAKTAVLLLLGIGAYVAWAKRTGKDGIAEKHVKKKIKQVRHKSKFHAKKKVEPEQTHQGSQKKQSQEDNSKS